MGGIGASILILISIVALLLFGPKKLPEFGRAIGTTLREFKQSLRTITEDHPDQVETKKVFSKSENK